MGHTASLSGLSQEAPDWLRHSELLNAALGYAALGWRVFPIRCPVFTEFGVFCSCGDPDCNPGKHPYFRNPFKSVTRNPDKIEEWWADHPDANVGIATGTKSGLVVLDVDPRNGGGESLAELIKKYGDIPNTITALSGGGGVHYYFEHPGGSIKSKAFGPDYPGLDIKAGNGCIIAPPSLHESGEKYCWVEGLEPQCTKLAPLPDWVLREMAKAQGKKARKVSRSGGTPTEEFRVTKGTRNNYLISFAGAVSTYCTTQTELEDYVSIHNETHCKPPLSRPEVKNITSSAAQYENSLFHLLQFRIWSKNTKLNRAEKAILCVLTRYCDWKTWRCFPTRETIAGSAGYSPTCTGRTLNSLSAKGLISWKTRPYQSNLYTVHVEKVLSCPIKEESDTTPSPPCIDTRSQRPTEETDSCPPDT